MILADFMVSGEWLTGFVVAIIGAVGGLYVKMRGDVKKAAESREVKLTEPVAEVPVKRVYSPPSFSQHMEIVRRVDALESDQRALRKDMAEGFLKLMEVGEERKDKIMTKIDDVAKGFHARVDQLVKGPNKR
jgi:chromosomal replication initiation ATPase DnaA